MKNFYLSLAIVTTALFAHDKEIALKFATHPPSSQPKENPPPLVSDLHYSFDAAFTYWFAKEDGLNVAESAQVDGSGTTVFASSPRVFQQDFGYHPGFILGAHFSFQDWTLFAEYTYYRGENQSSENAPAGSSGTGVWSLDSWYMQETFYSLQSLTGTALSSSWNLSIDMGDLCLSSRPAQKMGFAYAAFGGLRTLWIRQQMNLELNVAAASFGGSSFLASQPTSSHNYSHSWALGPRLGVNGRYNLPLEFHLEGTLGTSLLFSSFTVTHSESQAATYYAAPASLEMIYNCVRPELDLNLGFGWGRNVYNSQRLDLTASYDFAYFWGQNMMRSLMDEYVAGISSGSLDLYFQGVTLKAAYCF